MEEMEGLNERRTIAAAKIPNTLIAVVVMYRIPMMSEKVASLGWPSVQR